MNWKPVKNYPGYEISDEGQVRSYRVRNRNKITGFIEGYVISNNYILLKPQLSGNKSCQYKQITLYNENGRINKLIHILVLEHFASPSDKSFGLHKDDNRDNNHIDNLYWGDKQDNANDKMKNGHYTTMGEKCHLSKLTEKEVIEIRKLCEEGNLTQEEIGQKFNVFRNTISQIKNRILWKHI